MVTPSLAVTSSGLSGLAINFSSVFSCWGTAKCLCSRAAAEDATGLRLGPPAGLGPDGVVEADGITMVPLQAGHCVSEPALDSSTDKSWLQWGHLKLMSIAAAELRCWRKA